MKKFQYPFWNKTCPDCNVYAVEDFSRKIETEDIKRSGCYCPKCQKQLDFQMIENQVIWIDRVSYILESKEYTFIRQVQDSELFKIHGVSASWFHISRKVYSASSDKYEIDMRKVPEEIYYNNYLTLVYMLNNYLGRLYFFVPANAIV